MEHINQLNDVLEKFRDKNNPVVLILAYCFSSTNEFKTFMYKHGIMAFSNIKNERGDITKGKMFLLDEEQKQKMIKYIMLPLLKAGIKN